MSALAGRVVLAAMLLGFFPPCAIAQHIYIDANRDGVWDASDQLNPDTTTVLVWLNTIQTDAEGGFHEVRGTAI